MRECCRGIPSVDDSNWMGSLLSKWGVSDVHVAVLKDVHRSDDGERCGDQLVVEIVHQWGVIEVHADGRIMIKRIGPGGVWWTDVHRWKPVETEKMFTARMMRGPDEPTGADGE